MVSDNWKKTTKKKAGLIRRSFFTGISVLFPFFITVYILIFIYRFVNGIFGTYFNDFFHRYFGFVIPGFGLIITLLFIVLVGFFYNYFFGHKIWSFLEKMTGKIPLVASIYPSAKELSDFLFSSKSSKKHFQKVVSVEFPQEGTYSIGFITNEDISVFNTANEKELVAVFIPLAPTPVTGHIILLPKEKVKVLDLTIDQALKFVVSGGVVFPEKKGPQ